MDMTFLGTGGAWEKRWDEDYLLRTFDRLEYGFSKTGNDDHLRYMAAIGLEAPLLHGVRSNLSFSGFFLDRQDINVGWDNELMITESLGIIGALGGIRLANSALDPAFVYEAGLSGHLNYLTIYAGYSDHKGGSEGWFSGAFDTTPYSQGGLFFRLEVHYQDKK